VAHLTGHPALFAFYRYSLLHRCIHCRWGFIDELLPVHWPLPGDLGLDDILKESILMGRPVDIVSGTAPGWSDPWARAQRGLAVGATEWEIGILTGGTVKSCPRYEIEAVRIVGAP
jgi:hypothetical protein